MHHIIQREGYILTYECGFIGCGNMGGALAQAARQNLGGEEILLANRTREKADMLANKLGCSVGSNADVAENCRFIFLGVKPQMMEQMLHGIAPVLKERKDRFILVSMAAGLTINRIRQMAGSDYPVIRIMPNTPSSIGQGMIQYALSNNTLEEESERFIKLMSGAGLLDELPENLIDAGSAVSGCGPAFTDLFIEALADGGVQVGLPRKKALLYAAQMVKGSADLILQSGKHPAQLKDEVCSPGGSTIAGVHALEKGAFRSAVMDAVTTAFEKNRDLGKN